MGRPGRSRCELCGMGKRSGITQVCPDCGRNVCQNHLDLGGDSVTCKRCARSKKESPQLAEAP